MAPSVSIVIPAYNEERRLPDTLRKIDDWVAKGEAEVVEILVVDDGSRDETAKVPSTLEMKTRVRVISYSENAGKGYAIRRGIIEAKGDFVLISDADLSTPVSELPKLLAAAGSDGVAIGSRAIDRSLVKVAQAWHRDRMGRVFNVLMRGITGMPFLDTQCGFKLFPAPAARKIAREAIVDGFAWDVEFLLLAGRQGYPIAEVPVLWFDSPRSKVSMLLDPARMLRDMLKLRLRLGAFRGPVKKL